MFTPNMASRIYASLLNAVLFTNTLRVFNSSSVRRIRTPFVLFFNGSLPFKTGYQGCKTPDKRYCDITMRCLQRQCHGYTTPGL